MRLVHGGFRWKPNIRPRSCWAVLIVTAFSIVAFDAERVAADDRGVPAEKESARQKIDPQKIWRRDLKSAIAEAKRDDRPLLVVSVLGDLTKRC